MSQTTKNAPAVELDMATVGDALAADAAIKELTDAGGSLCIAFAELIDDARREGRTHEASRIARATMSRARALGLVGIA
jgi:hypothetical protein